MITEEHRRHLSESHMGIKRTPESIEKCRKAMKIKWANPRFKIKMREALKGRIVTEKTKQKISKAHISISLKQEKQIIKLYENLIADEISIKLNLHRSVIYGCLRRHKIKPRRMGIRNGNIPWNKNLKLSEEQKARLNLTGLDLGRAWNKGIPITKEQFEKLNAGLKNWIRLKGHYPNWQGGTSFEPYTSEFNEYLKLRIRKRDDFTCQFPKCGRKENGRAHDVHHINHDKKDSREENLITLCYFCHPKIKADRNYWKNYFQDLIKSKPKEYSFAL